VNEQRFSYVGIAGAVAGIVGLFGIYATWWETELATYHGVADVSGKLALAMSIGLFAFGGGYVLLSDAGIRRALGALVTLCAVVLTFACVWALGRGDQVAQGTSTGQGILVSALGGIVGIAAGLLSLRNSQIEDAGPSAGA
jgi:hypothetical protein